MNREIVIAFICALSTIALGWLIDHPHKLAGTLILLVAFGIIVLVARLRGAGPPRLPRRMIRRHPPHKQEGNKG